MSTLANHQAKLASHLARFADREILNLIGGVDVSGADWFETRSPVDESLIARVALGTRETVDVASAAAKAAFAGWAALAGDKRRVILHRIADLIEERAEGNALCECWDTGQA
jgi:5-carboxymethyl-2-hydroxymuconic-semialdehyde dehydrogenase